MSDAYTYRLCKKILKGNAGRKSNFFIIDKNSYLSINAVNNFVIWLIAVTHKSSYWILHRI